MSLKLALRVLKDTVGDVFVKIQPVLLVRQVSLLGIKKAANFIVEIKSIKSAIYGLIKRTYDA